MISAVVLTKNEEGNIVDCLEGLKWCDEILVVDDASTDRTVELAKREKVQVINRPLNGDFAAQRNFALEKTNFQWILFVDADERVSPELAEEIQSKIKETDLSGFFLKRQDFFMGRFLKHGETSRVRLLRLGKRRSGYWKRIVDEVWEVKGKTETLENPLKHYPHPSLREFLESINERSSLNARVFYEQGKRLTPLEWLKPKFKFIQNYFLRLGFLDGVSGFVFAILMSLHSFSVRVKLYLIWRKEGGWR